MGVQADRLYVGDTLVWDAASAPTEAGWVDLFDRAEIGPNYTVFNTLPGGASATASCSPLGVTVGGYTPAAVRQVGRACRVFARFTSGANPHVLSMYQDNNNWTSWTPDNGPDGRIRHREGGTNRDITVPRRVVGVLGEFGYQVTSESTTYYINRVAVVADVTGDRNIDHAVAGIGSAGTGGGASFTSLKMVPIDPPDLAAALIALSVTSSNADVATALMPATEWAGARIEVETATAAPFAAPTVDGDADAMAMAGIAAAEISRYPAGIHGRLTQTWRVRVGTDLVSGGNPASGVYYTNGHVVHVAKVPTATHLADVSSDMATARASVVNHEVAHMLHLSTPFTDAKVTLEAAFIAANPSEFTYGTAGPRRPDGFCRGYGMTNIAEDIADVFAWMQTDGLRPELISRVATDVRLRAKAAAMKAFLAASGWSPSRFADIPT